MECTYYTRHAPRGMQCAVTGRSNCKYWDTFLLGIVSLMYSRAPFDQHYIIAVTDLLAHKFDILHIYIFIYLFIYLFIYSTQHAATIAMLPSTMHQSPWPCEYTLMSKPHNSMQTYKSCLNQANVYVHTKLYMLNAVTYKVNSLHSSLASFGPHQN